MKGRWSVRLVCKVLEVSESGYYGWCRVGRKAQSENHVSDKRLLTEIRAIDKEVNGEYGWPRMWHSLKRNGFRVGKERVRKLMQAHGIKGKVKRKYVVTTDSSHQMSVVPNLVDRQFNPAAPDVLWTSDITYLPTDQGWLYLSVVLDLFGRRIVGWSIKPHMQTDLVKDALLMAWLRRRPPTGLIFHSDRGSQYCSSEFQTTLKTMGITASMSRKADCWDNAPVESFWARLKAACLQGRKFRSHSEAHSVIMAWISFYNHRRLHSSLEYMSPMEYEQRWHNMQTRKSA